MGKFRREANLGLPLDCKRDRVIVYEGMEFRTKTPVEIFARPQDPGFVAIIDDIREGVVKLTRLPISGNTDRTT